MNTQRDFTMIWGPVTERPGNPKFSLQYFIFYLKLLINKCDYLSQKWTLVRDFRLLGVTFMTINCPYMSPYHTFQPLIPTLGSRIDLRTGGFQKYSHNSWRHDRYCTIYSNMFTELWRSCSSITVLVEIYARDPSTVTPTTNTWWSTLYNGALAATSPRMCTLLGISVLWWILFLDDGMYKSKRKLNEEQKPLPGPR